MSFEINIDNSQHSPVIHLIDHQNHSSAEIYAFGGLLNAFTAKVGGKDLNVVSGYESVADAIKNICNGFKSAKLSPFVCRMKEGKYKWNEEQFLADKWFLGNHAIHGIIYDATYSILSSKTDAASASVVLEYAYTGTETGYPFPYLIQLIWTLEKNNRLSVTSSITNVGASAIPLSDGWHPYFTLGDSIDDDNIQFNSNQQVEFDADLLPTGKLIPETRFENGISLNGIFLDNCFVLNKTIATPKCILSNKNVRFVIEPSPAYPYLQIYTPDDRKKIAIENLSSAPDAFNNSMGLIVLQPKETRDFTTRYSIIAG